LLIYNHPWTTLNNKKDCSPSTKNNKQKRKPLKRYSKNGKNARIRNQAKAFGMHKKNLQEESDEKKGWLSHWLNRRILALF
jgi:hypothetical protein